MEYFGKGKVVRVVDGDTIHVKSKSDLYVRFVGIDTPEVHKKQRCFYINGIKLPADWLHKYGLLAKDVLTTMLLGKTVRLYTDELLGETGHYGRLLCYVYHRRRDIGKWLIQQGYAKIYPNEFEKLAEYGYHQYRAMKKMKGVWSYVKQL